MLEIIASLFQVAYDQRAHVRGIKILTWLRVSLVIFLYFCKTLSNEAVWQQKAEDALKRATEDSDSGE